MAGHRRTPRRPSPQWLKHAEAAQTPDEQLAVGYDRLRTLLAHLRRRQRDPQKRAADVARADRLAVAVAGYLHELCEREERDRQ